MERILMISYFAPPVLSAESILVGKLLPELARHYQVDLIAVGEDPDFRKDEALAKWMTAENVHVYRYNNPKPANKIVRRLYQKSSALFQDVNDKWMRQVLLHHKLQPPYKLIYSRSQPGISHLVAHEFKHRLGIPWVAQFSDPWANNPYHQYPVEWMHAVDQKNEATVIRNANRLIFPTLEIRNLVASHYPDVKVKGISSIFPHYFADCLYGEADAANPAESGSREGRIVISHIGDFYGLRSPEPLLKALAAIEQKRPEINQRLHVRMIGNVEQKFHSMIDTMREKTGATVERVGQVPYLQSLAEMKQSDILLLVDAPSDVNLFLPSKLIDYFGARKPIMGITSQQGTTGSLIRQYGFPVIDPREPERIAAALIDMAEEFDRYSRRAADNDYEIFTAESVAAELVNLFEHLRQ
jgi:glycosyltransferase involved in cell wall biosynthesis